MKILLDECVDSRLARHFSEFEVQTVHDRGWSGITNGKLLALAQVEFDVFVTVSRERCAGQSRMSAANQSLQRSLRADELKRWRLDE